MKIVLLGTGSSALSLTRRPTSFLVIAQKGALLLDIGPSILRKLIEIERPPDMIDVVLLTHFHPDHTADLASFLFDCNYGISPRRKPLTIIAGKGVGLFLRRLMRLYPCVKPQGYQLVVKPAAKRVQRIGGFTMATAPANHKAESIAVCLKENGKNAVFWGDTDYSPALVEFASRTDLLFTECTFPSRKREGHLNLATLMKMVKEARPKQVILTHLDPEWEEFPVPLPPPLLLGEDGMEIVL